MRGSPLFDVLVVGGGPAGAASAITLARRGRRVLLVDALARSAHPGESLPPAALPMLRDLGVGGAALAEHHLVSYGTCSAWGSPRLHSIDFLRSPHGLGYHLDRTRFDAFLRARAVEAGAEVIEDARVTRHGAEDEVVSLTRGDEELRVRARWVVDATGRRAAVARRRGARRVARDRLVAFVARFRAGPGAPVDHDTRTLVEAVPNGWWYSARLPSQERILAFLTDADLPSTVSLLSPDAFLVALDHTTHARALVEEAGYTLVGRVRGGDASSRALDRVAGSDWLAVGDAALAVDPLSSQGITNALYTGLMAGRALAAALDGDTEAVATYVAQVGRVERAYRANLREVYRMETRWRDRPFWRRRHASPGADHVSP